MKHAAAAACLILGLGGCESVRDAVGLNKNPPDEFAVMTRAPLSVPPTFDLQPPRPGMDRPQEVSTDQQAKKARLGGRYRPQGHAGSTPAETAFLQRAGAVQGNTDVRAVLDRENADLQRLRDDPVDRVLHADELARKQQPVIRSAAELQRIRAAKAQGQAVTGSEAKTQPVREKSLWDRLFR
jgi:hypothetical protein